MRICWFWAVLRIFFTVVCQRMVEGARLHPNYTGRAFRTDVELFRSGYSTIKFGVGTPPMFIYGDIQTRSALITVVDSGCGRLPAGRRCPRYCRIQGKVQMFYCHPFCGQVLNIAYFCSKKNFIYYSANSSTAKLGPDADVYEKTLDHLRGYKDTAAKIWPTWGYWGLETLRFWVTPWGPDYPKGPEFPMTDSLINRAIMYDAIRFLSIFGIRSRGADGTRSIVPRLHSQLQIPQPFLSFSMSRVEWHRHKALDRFGGVMTIGALDSAHCYDWIFAPEATHPWSFWMDDIVFMGEPLPGRTLGRLNVEGNNIKVEGRTRERLVLHGLWAIEGSTMVVADCDNPLSLSFRIDGHLIELGHHDLGFYAEPCAREDRTITTTKLWVPNVRIQRRYYDETPWEFGTYLLERFCFGYDYESDRIAWGKRRRVVVEDFY